ncbi:hypothetical protein V5E97_19115 [Singulisphaera sp. Ch08]|uniref:Peptidase S9 prolyl oligopeptidase catalytic domain-containing protein n=1 Tax=Singulisphaera sp. Ch08 TaxID=3120278 RepID=A0AAU7CRZ2_9BACT
MKPTHFATAASVFLLLCSPLAAVATAGAPAEDGLLLTRTISPGDGDRFERAEFSCWIPDTKKPVRGVIVHQHGCTNAAPEQHPPVTGDCHWRALARNHDCALLVPMYRVAGACDEWNDPDSGSERALLAALAGFARDAGRAELTDVPWVFWGHSGGSSWSAQMILRHPGRVLAASFRGGCHKQFGSPEFRARFLETSRELPLLFVWGKREAVPSSSHFVSWEPMNAMYRALRLQGSPAGRVVDPRSEHNCDDSRLIIIPFFDAVLSARTAGEKPAGVLVDIATRERRDTTTETLRDPALAWLPTPDLAEHWREFSEHGTLRPVNPRLAPPQLFVDRTLGKSARLAWRISPALDGGLRVVRIHRDGRPWKELGLKPADSLATGRDSPPVSLRAHGLEVDASEPHTYTLTFLDAAGNESPPSAAVHVGP